MFSFCYIPVASVATLYSTFSSLVILASVLLFCFEEKLYELVDGYPQTSTPQTPLLTHQTVSVLNQQPHLSVLDVAMIDDNVGGGDVDVYDVIDPYFSPKGSVYDEIDPYFSPKVSVYDGIDPYFSPKGIQYAPKKTHQVHMLVKSFLFDLETF